MTRQIDEKAAKAVIPTFIQLLEAYEAVRTHTVTEAEVEKAAEAMRNADFMNWPAEIGFKAAIAALGITVRG